MATATLHRTTAHRAGSATGSTARYRSEANPPACSHRHRQGGTVSVVPQRTGLRLTHRGRVLLTIALLVVVSALAVVGALRATAAPSTPPVGWVEVIVQPGDSLWGIASTAQDAGTDPRAIMADIRSVNGLASAHLAAGERIWVPGPAA
jgi:hypothetical protein